MSDPARVAVVVFLRGSIGDFNLNILCCMGAISAGGRDDFKRHSCQIRNSTAAFLVLRQGGDGGVEVRYEDETI